MSEKHLHIVSFNVPYPADYGGVIDVFFRIKALHEAGVNITLHCFEYGRGPSVELEKFCSKVLYYRRKKNLLGVSIKKPFIVSSRRDDNLLGNLFEDDHPILFEGLHSCYYLPHQLLADRKKLVRMHNVEWKYYQGLAGNEKKAWKRIYFLKEAGLLKQYEKVLNHADCVFAISPEEKEYFSQEGYKTVYLPAFHGNQFVDIHYGKGDFCLYHGNLSVSENIEAALFLVKVFTQIEIPLVIAGMAPDLKVISAVKNIPHIKLLPDPAEEELLFHIKEAHINILPAFQKSGIKLKLLKALFNGRHCLVNQAMVENTGLESLCLLAESEEEFRAKILELMDQPFSEEMFSERKKILEEDFSDSKNRDLVLARI